MATTTFTAVPPFEVVLLRKHPISLLRKVKIPLFQGNAFFHPTTIWLPKVTAFPIKEPAF